MSSERNVRVFVSSTFRDMMAERDYLVKTIFPQLRKICESRGVTWGEVDLRWGIPDEDRDDVIPLCLEEIRRCRPHFICLLGERYGYVPDEIPAVFIERYPWLERNQHKSITELEIVFGCLAKDLPLQQAFFYLRDPSYLDRLPPGSHRADFESLTAEASQQLARLKDEIRAAAQQGVCTLRQDYRSPQELGEWILEDFTRLIERQFPAGEALDPLRQESAAQLSFARRLSRVYIQRPGAFTRLDAHIDSSSPPLVVVGEAGAGKSALLANWFLQRPALPGEICLVHFTGSTPGSTDPVKILRRVMLELKSRLAETQNPLEAEIPLDADAIRREFPLWIRRAAGEKRLILILDAVDQAEGPGASELGWLPDEFPPDCRVILAAPPGRWLEAARRRGWQELALAPLSVEERLQLLQQYLAQYSRRLSPPRMQRITQAGQTSNPLFLCAMLEELRQFGEHERLGERIEYYLQAATPDQLFERILQRLEGDYQPELELVRKSLSLIACARNGLSEAELLDLLGSPRQPFPFRWWTPLSLAIEQLLLNASGLLNFAAVPLRQAVERRYLSDPASKRQVHRRLAAYFEFLPLPAAIIPQADQAPGISFSQAAPASRRVLDELPWQQAQAQDWRSLLETLTLLPLFETAYLTDQGLEWLSYWQMLRQAQADGLISNLNMAERYLHEFRQLGDAQKFALAGALGQFLMACGLSEAAGECLRYESEYLGQQAPAFARAANLNDQAQALGEQGRLEEALALYQSAEELLLPEQDELENRRCLASVLMNRANLMKQLGQTAGVKDRLEQALALMQETTGEDSPEVATALQSLGNFASSLGDYPKALSLHQQAYELRLKRLGPRHRDVAISLTNLGNALAQQGKIFRGMQCLERAVDIFQETLGPEHSYTHLAVKNLEQLKKLEP